jgi:hypothetical protein
LLVGRLRRLVNRLRFRPFLEGERTVDNVDGLTAARGHNQGPYGPNQAFPVDYVRPVDEGRPRK